MLIECINYSKMPEFSFIYVVLVILDFGFCVYILLHFSFSFSVICISLTERCFPADAYYFRDLEGKPFL